MSSVVHPGCSCKLSVLLQAFGPLVFYDVSGQELIPDGSSSIVNVIEVEMVLCVYRELVHAYPELRTKPSVAVISPYKAQVGPALPPCPALRCPALT